MAGFDRKTFTLLPPDATQASLRPQARVDAWNLYLEGVGPDAIAGILNERYKLAHGSLNYKGRDIQKLLESTKRSKRVAHEQDAGDRMLVAEGRLENILENIWQEIHYERGMRERWLAGEFDANITIGPPPGKEESELERRARLKKEKVAFLPFANSSKDPRFSIPKLLQEARATVVELTKLQGVTPDIANHITVTNNHLTVMAEELLGDPRTEGIGKIILDQLTRAAGDDETGDGGTPLLGTGAEAGCIEGEYFPAGTAGGTLEE